MGASAAAGALGFPMIAKAQSTPPIQWKMTSAYAKGAPFYMDGPGSATDLAKCNDAMSNGRLKISVYGAGEMIPAFEGFPALERGVIDAAEFVGPYQDRRLGLHKAAKYLYTTGWHECATVSELLINKAAWDKLPKDLQAIVENACAACNVISEGWCQRTNAEAMEDLIKNQGVIARPLPDDVIKALRDATNKVLAEAIKDPLTKKVHDSYMAYLAKYASWAAYN